MHQGTERVDLYRIVHKGLRAALAHTLVEAGKIDTTDLDDTARVLEGVRTLVEMCRTHLELEDTFIHGAMLARRPGSESQTLGDHAHHKEDFVEIESAVRAIEDSLGAARIQAARRLYARLAVFVADNYTHMQVEETHNNAVLQAEFTDAELLGIKGRLLASIAPETNLRFLRWMAPSVSPAERAELLLGARPAMPPAAFEAGVALVKEHLNARDRFKLQLALTPLPAAA